MTISLSNIRSLVAMLLFCILASPAFAREPAHQDIWVPLADSPAGETVYYQPVHPPHVQSDPSWAVRTGVKKGVLDRELDAEVFAGPDAAVLKNGFYGPWQSLLAQFSEPSVLVEPWQVAGLEHTKPYLIVPSGGLSGLSESQFFKAGLAEYVMSGGVVICFTQQNGIDLSGLPIPRGSELPMTGAGWAEDAGPLFRASSVQNNHPMLAGTKKTTPNVETSGYLATVPHGSKVLLSRSDGFPTLVVYPCGSGWVVVTTMFSDFSFERGHLDQDEKTLVRDILRWAKSPAHITATAPGEKLNLTLSVHGREQDAAASVKIRAMGPEGDKPLSEEVVKLSVKEHQTVSLPYSYAVPAAVQSGIYRFEYLLLDNAGRALGGSRESDADSFSIGNPPPAPPIPQLSQPLSGLPMQLKVQPSLVRSGGALRLILSLVSDAKALAGMRQTFFVRAAGHEKLFAIGTESEGPLLRYRPQSRGQEKLYAIVTERAALSLNIPEQDAGEKVSYVIYHSSGRSLARGTVPVAGPAGEMVSFDKQPAFAGRKTAVTITTPGKGEFTLAAPGKDIKRMITGSSSLDFTLPADLPAGTYPLRWKFTPQAGKPVEGAAPLNIDGYRVRVLNAGLENKADKDRYSCTARLRIDATQKVQARIKLWVREPDGRTVPVADNAITLKEGAQEVPLLFTFTPESAGIGELRYSISAPLSMDPNPGTIDLAAGRMLFDIGETALLGVAASRPVYYEPSGPVEVSAYVVGKGRTRIELLLDNKKVRKEKLDLSGPLTYTMPIPDIGPGTHTVKAIVTGEKLESSAGLTVVYGARLPDLAISLRPTEPAGVVMHVGISIRNQGKSAAPRSRAALYEGDPARGGTLIAGVDVPPLDPGKEHAAVIDWPLYKRSGIRTLTAIADADSAIAESNKGNNAASTEVKIPDLLFMATPQKSAFTSDEKLSLEVLAANLSTDAYKDLVLSIELVDRSGKAVSSDSVPITELAVGSEKRISRGLGLAQLPVEQYQLRAQIVKNGPLSTATSTIDVLPTLLVSGALDETPQTAALCTPMTIQYSLKSAGNIPVSSGTSRVEITSTRTGQSAYARQVPFAEGPGSARIDTVNFAPGPYTITVKASVANTTNKITKDFLLAERALTVSTPLEVKKGGNAVPRVLLWRSKTGTTVQQAMAEKIVRQAFEENDVFYTVVDKTEDFMNKALSGVYNTAILFETDEVLAQSDWLRDQVAHGLGLAIIGPEERSRMAAETLGFTFSEAPATGAMLMFTEGSDLGLSGTLPVSGRILLPQKNNADPAALYAGDKKTAILLDRSGKGRVMVLPFSFTRSALDVGTSSIYSLLLRAVIRAVAPEQEEQTRVSSTNISVSAAAGAVKARVVATLPAGSSIIWTNAGGTAKNNAVTYELTADKEEQKLLCLYLPPAGVTTAAAVETFLECKGKFISQGKIE